MKILSRRQALLACAGTVAALAADKKRPVSLEGYIFQNLAAREKKPLAEMIGGLYADAVAGGYNAVELNDGFFTPALRQKIVELTRTNHLLMPSVYVGGGTHTEEMATATIAKALDIGAVCKEFGCVAIVNNPNTKQGNAAKTEEELAIQAKSLNRMGKVLLEKGFQLRIHHHAVEMANDLQEWRHILHNTDARYVSLCIDIEHAFRSKVDPVLLLKEAGKRTSEVHLRSTRGPVPLETFEEADIDHSRIAQTIRALKIDPLYVVELAYHDDTPITRSFAENLKLSRMNAEKIFGASRQ